MKKQGSLYLKLISIVLAVFLVTYALLSFFVGSGVGHTIETVVYCEVGDGETVSGTKTGTSLEGSLGDTLFCARG